MSDIVETLRLCAKDSREVEGDYYADQFATAPEVFDEAADEIERLRSQPCPYVTGTVTRYCTLNTSEKPNSSTLTDEEREAVEVCAHAAENCNGFGGDPTRPAIYDGRQVAATLRGLLGRLKTANDAVAKDERAKNQ